MASSFLKEQVYLELSRISHALSHPKRMELLDVLSQRDFSVEELSTEISMSMASTSQHLQVLKSAKLVETKRNGNFIIYSVAEEKVWSIMSLIREFGFKKNAEIAKVISDFKEDKKQLESISLEDFLARSKKEKILLLDVRPLQEFEAGHIPKAISIPLHQLKGKIKDLPKEKIIIAYCRGPLCVMAAEAVKMLKEKKFSAFYMEDGYVEWKLKQSNLRVA